MTSAKAANTYECLFSTKRPGLHFLPEQVMNKFTQSEADDSVTAGSEASFVHCSHDVAAVYSYRRVWHYGRKVENWWFSKGIHPKMALIEVKAKDL